MTDVRQKNPPLDNPLLQNLTPHLARRGFQPEPGGRISVMLPGELVSAVVVKAVSDDAVIVQLGPVFFGKHHQYQANDVVPCRRGFDKVLQTEYWEVVSTRAAALASAVAQFERSEVERVAAANAQFDRAEAALSGPDASAAPQADIGQAPPPTVIQPSPTQPSPTASLPQADTDHRSSAAPDAVETRIVEGKDGTLKRESKPRRGRGKPPQPHQA